PRQAKSLAGSLCLPRPPVGLFGVGLSYSSVGLGSRMLTPPPAPPGTPRPITPAGRQARRTSGPCIPPPIVTLSIAGTRPALPPRGRPRRPPPPATWPALLAAPAPARVGPAVPWTL